MSETELRLRRSVAELEQKNQSLRSELELAHNELAHKSAILVQTSTELADLQTQYKQVLQKLVEVSQRPETGTLEPAEERFYRTQLREQSACIAALEDRVWRAGRPWGARGDTGPERAERAVPCEAWRGSGPVTDSVTGVNRLCGYATRLERVAGCIEEDYRALAAARCCPRHRAGAVRGSW